MIYITVEEYLKLNNHQKGAYNKDLIKEGVRFCSACENFLPLDKFCKNKRSLYGLADYCRQCHYKKHQIYREKYPNVCNEERKRRLLRDPDFEVLASNRYHKKHPKRCLLNRAKKRAKKKNIEFNIDENDFEIPEFCPILGIKLESSVGKGSLMNNTPSLDRADISKGYVKGNVNVISCRANVIKNCGTTEEHIRIVNWMKSKNIP